MSGASVRFVPGPVELPVAPLPVTRCPLPRCPLPRCPLPVARYPEIGLRSTGHGLRATAYGPRSTGHGLRATAYGPRSTGNWQLATGNWRNWQLATAQPTEQRIISRDYRAVHRPRPHHCPGAPCLLARSRRPSNAFVDRAARSGNVSRDREAKRPLGHLRPRQ
jgi:hypothetical protein